MWFSQRSAWQEVASTKHTSALGTMACVDLGEHTVLVQSTSTSGRKDEEMLQCASDVVPMLQAMSFVCHREVGPFSLYKHMSECCSACQHAVLQLSIYFMQGKVCIFSSCSTVCS
jgi:hypothetical protein